MGFLDSFGKALGATVKEKAAKNSALKEMAQNMGEYELIAMYKSAKRKGEFLALGNAIGQLKERFGYTDEDFKNLKDY